MQCSLNRKLPFGLWTVSNDIISETCPNQRFYKGKRNLQNSRWNSIGPSRVEVKLLMFVEDLEPLKSHGHLRKSIDDKNCQSIEQSAHVGVGMKDVDFHPRSQKHSHRDSCGDDKLRKETIFV